MKGRDHEKIIANMKQVHAAQCTRLRRVSAEHLCTYLSPATFNAVCADIDAIADSAAAPLLTLLAELKKRREDGAKP